jgi:hypothetical protein
MSWSKHILLGLIGLVFLNPLTCWGQTNEEPIYENFVPTPFFQLANEAVEMGEVQTALEIYAKIAKEHPGTTLAATCLFRQAKYSENPGPIYEKIIIAYPHSRFEILARLALLNLKYERDPSARWLATDQLAQSYGGPSKNTIVDVKNESALVSQIKALPREIQDGLSRVYLQIWINVAFEQGKWREGLPLGVFTRDAFFQFNDSIEGTVRYNWCMSNGKNWEHTLLVDQDPKIVVRSPGPVTDTDPTFVFEIDEIPSETPVSLQKMICKLDDRDFTPDLIVTSQMAPLEFVDKIYITGQPSTPLNKGVHRLTLTVPVNGYSGTGPGQTTITVDFRVEEETKSH